MCVRSLPLVWRFMINIENMITVSKLLRCRCFVKRRLDKSSTVVVEVASFVGPPVPTPSYEALG